MSVLTPSSLPAPFTNLTPASVWTHFATLCRIPRPSKHEGVLRDHLVAWAQARGLATQVDEAGNLIVRLPDLAAAAARIAASEAFWFASKESIQVHGGMGFTWDVDCHLFYRRSRQLSLVAGAPKVWKERLVSQLEQKNAA